MSDTSTYVESDGTKIPTKRKPTKTELAILELAKAIDSMELAMREQESTLDRMLPLLEEIAHREEWVDHYRADDRALEELEGL